MSATREKPAGLQDWNAGPDVVQAMPHAIGPEKSILSSMLKDPEQWIGRAIEEGITREHFYFPAHGELFDVIRELNAAGKEVELVSLIQTLHDRGLLDRIGGPAAVTDIFTYAPNAAHFEGHAGIVKDKHVLRRLIRASTEACAAAYSNPEEVPAVLDRAEAEILAIRQGAETAKSFDPKRGVQAVFDWLKGLIAGEADTRATPTGYPDLDRMAKGLKPGEMFVVAARPSMGKTSFLMNVAEHVCIDQGIPSLVFSCEMTAFQLMQRLIFARARFNAGKVERGFKPTKEELLRLKLAGEQIATAPIYIDDTPGLMIDTLRAKARRQKREKGIGFIGIDYLQLLRSGSKQAQNAREREIGEISAGIKSLAKELDVPILVLAQLNRGPEGRSGKSLGVPRMSDLRESGTIEQDADMVGLLYRAAYYAETQEERDESAGEAELILAKNRNGETGHVSLTFIAELMRFESRARHQP
jgi:replicative DNA helicase